jgi:hypothetical protein
MIRMMVIFHFNHVYFPASSRDDYKTNSDCFWGCTVKLRQANIGFVMSVRLSAWTNSVPTGRIFMKFDIWELFENLLRKFKFHWNLTRTAGTSRKDRYTFMIISRSVLPRMKNVSDKRCRENKKKYFMFNLFFFNRVLYEILVTRVLSLIVELNRWVLYK